MSISWRVKIHDLYENNDRCQVCIRCIEGVCISESLLCEVSLYCYVECILSGVTTNFSVIFHDPKTRFRKSVP